MELQVKDHDGTLLIGANAQRLDAAVAIEFKDKMREITGETGCERIVLDLSQVDFLDSSGLGAVVASMKQLSSGKRLELCGLTPAVDKVFRLTRMDSVFTLHETPEAALQVDVA